MKTLKKITMVNAIIIASFVLTSVAWVGAAQRKMTEKPINGKGFAVLELFTSEGCNSCPPAEDLLEKIDKEANGRPIYVLSYHVDYFDNLGWKDVFGSPENTKRQQKYSNWLKTHVYTPQLVINGTKEFVGSDEREIYTAIEQQLLFKRKAELSLTTQKTGNLLKVTYQTKGNEPNEDLVLALVQKNGRTEVKRGENVGRTLSHIQIVRNMSTISLKDAKSGSANLVIPDSLDTAQWEVIGLLQNRKTGAISAVNNIKVI